MVGSHFVDFLMNETEIEIILLMRHRSSFVNLSSWSSEINNKNRIFVEYGDINDFVSLSNIFQKHKFDFVSHLAAQSFPRTSFDSPIETLQTNIIGTANILECCKKYCSDAKIHICASSEVFGRVPKEAIPIHEENMFHPASPYAISKAGTDLLGRFYGEGYGLKVFTTRMFTHTGPRRTDVFAESTFAKQIALIEKGLIEPIVKVGNLNSMRTFADVRDAVRAYWLGLNAKFVPGSYFNIGGNFSCTIGDMLNFLIKQAKVNPISIEKDMSRMRPLDADLQIPDCSKFKELVSWKPEYSFEKTMTDLLNYWRERISLHSGETVVR